MKVVPPSLAPILRSAAQGRILASVLADPAREQSLTDLAEAGAASFPTVKREVERAEDAGLVTIRQVGRTRLVRANDSHPLYDAVRRVVLGTFGVPAIVTREFAGLGGVAAVALFGSWAARYLGRRGPSPADVDVFVIGDPDRDALDEAAERAERLIGLPVQVTVRTVGEWERSDESFLREVKRRPIVALVIDDESPVGGELRRLERQVITP